MKNKSRDTKLVDNNSDLLALLETLSSRPISKHIRDASSRLGQDSVQALITEVKEILSLYRFETEERTAFNLTITMLEHFYLMTTQTEEVLATMFKKENND